MRKDRTTGYYDPVTETLPPAERERFLLERVRSFLSHAYTHAPAVREALDGAGVDPQGIRSLQDLERVPITRKDHLVERQKKHPPFGGFLGVPLGQVPRVYMSPGPLYEPHAYNPRNLAQSFYAGGLRAGDIAQVTYAYHLVPAGFMMEEGLRTLGCVAIPGGTGNTELQVQMMKDLGVTAFVGTPSFLATLLQRAEALGLRPGRGLSLEVAAVGAEPLPESLRQEIEGRYGVVVRQGYGTADLGVVAYECYHAGGMHLVDEALVEVVDPGSGKPLPPGEVGEVVVTPFTSIYCLVRFGTGDAAYLTTDPCPCGRTAPKIGRIVGRVGEAVKVRGMFVHPKQVEEALARFPQVARYRVLVTREGYRDVMTLQVELMEAVAEPGRLERDLAEAIQGTTKLKVDRVETVAPGTIEEGGRRVVDQRRWD